MELIASCVFCGDVMHLTLNDVKYAKYMSGVPIAEAFPDLDIFLREQIVSQVCVDCQEKIYNTPTEQHREEWGRELGECRCCGTRLYMKHNKDKEVEGQYICPSCYTKYTLNKSSHLEEVNEYE